MRYPPDIPVEILDSFRVVNEIPPEILQSFEDAADRSEDEKRELRERMSQGSN